MGNVCTKCGAEIAPGNEFCGTCGTRFQKSAAPAIRRKGRDALWISIAVSVLLFFILMGTVGDKSGSTSTGDDEDRDGTMSVTAYCAGSDSDVVPLMNAYSQADTEAVLGLVSRGKVMELKEGTAVHVFFREHGVSRIEVKSGFHSGETCWLPGNVVH